MSWRLDARIPVVFGPPDLPGDGALLVEEGRTVTWAGPVARFAAGTHAPACPCCGGRSAAAAALSELFVASMRGEARFSHVCVLASTAGETAVREALRNDPFACARFRELRSEGE